MTTAATRTPQAPSVAVCGECQDGMCVNCPLGLLNFFGTRLIDCGCPDPRHDEKRAQREREIARLGLRHG